MRDPADVAKSNAWFAARSVCCDNRDAASIVIRTAEITVLRRLVAAQLAGGETEYWKLVEKEIDS